MAETTQDPRDARIVELEAQVKRLEAEDRAKTKQLEKLRDQKLDDCVILAGKKHAITGTYRANPTFDEVKKGHLDEGVTLIAIAKAH